MDKWTLRSNFEIKNDLLSSKNHTQYCRIDLGPYFVCKNCGWMLPSLQMDFQLLTTTKYIMLMIVCIFPRMLKTFWERGWNSETILLIWNTVHIKLVLLPSFRTIYHSSQIKLHIFFFWKTWLIKKMWTSNLNLSVNLGNKAVMIFIYWYFISVKSNTY